MNCDKYEKVFSKCTSSKLIHEAVLYVESSDGKFSMQQGYGGRSIDTPMLCASVTKLFTTTCILRLCEAGKLSLADPITKYFDREWLKGLHVYKGKEYTYDLSVYHLLTHTSGLPDRFEDGRNSEVMLKGDMALTFEESFLQTKEDTPLFAPGTKNRAYYCNMNFDLLGKIIEMLYEDTLQNIYDREIFVPLKLGNTYLAVNEEKPIPYSYYKQRKLNCPNIILTSGAAGGCISTPRDLMVFSKAFWGGKLFNKEMLIGLNHYNGLQRAKGPINYGGGYMQIPLHSMLTSYQCKGELVGHCGSTGSFVFYYPEKDMHYVGDIAQIYKPALPIRLLLRLVMIH